MLGKLADTALSPFFDFKPHVWFTVTAAQGMDDNQLRRYLEGKRVDCWGFVYSDEDFSYKFCVFKDHVRWAEIVLMQAGIKCIVSD